MLGTVSSVWAFSLVALAVLWRQRPPSVLDLWLMVVMCAWLLDIALSAMLNAGRFDLGFYAGRLYGLLACGAVLLELLLENGMLYARLVRLREEAQAASRAKSLFLASMSHEIRTPMNAVIGLTQLVLETRLTPQQHDYLSKVQTSSRALLSLLNDILDYSKIEAGKTVLEREEFSPEETIENVGNLFAAKVEEGGLELLFEIDEKIPRRMVGDSLRLAQVLNNLVGNAIKFTPRGEIVVRAEALTHEGERRQLRFSVRDTGIGLSAEQAARLFQPFGQADASITRRYGGTGLGLAICKRLVELMGGEISVVSEPGRGSTFSFTAWMDVAHEPAARLDPLRVRGMRTLVVDSQPTARLILQQALQSWRFQVGTAPFPDDALHKLRRAEPQAPYELLVVDWKTVDGAAFVHEARRLVAHGGPQRLLVVALAGLHQREQVQQALAGVDHAVVLVKPVTPSRLFDAVVRLQHGEGPALPPPGGGRLDLAAALEPIRGARVLLVEDNLVNQQVAQAVLSMARLQVTVAGNGLEAVDWVKRERFDAVLMDMQMPDMDGLQATRVIRGLPEGESLPVIAMTAAAMDEDRQECLAAGMNAHVSKPIDPRELARVLLKWVALPAGARALAAPAGQQTAG
jgi:signal transduction histidine kinase/CheY-like chemotaxis protein